MKRPDFLQEAVDRAARLAYHETELSPKGQALKTQWEQDAQEWVEDELTGELWDACSRAVGRVILRTEGGLAGINGWRASEELEPLADAEALYEDLADNPWDLAMLGKDGDFRITVWAHPAFEGSFACAVAEDFVEERVLSTLTSLL